MAKMDNADKMLVAFLPQSPSGTAQPDLVDSEYAELKFGTNNLIDLGLTFTGFNWGGYTIETEERGKSITDLTRQTYVSSTGVKAGEIGIPLERPLDLTSVVDALEEITGVDDQFLGLFLVGKYKSAGTGTRLFDVVCSCAAVLIAEGSANGEAGKRFTGELKFQPSGKYKTGKTGINKTATLTTSTNSVAIAATTTGT